MNYRNPKFTASGDIDCEIEHPDFGWIPFTASPTDAEAHGRELFAQITADAGPIAAYVPPPPTSAQVNAERDRRLAAGVVVSVTGYGDVAVQGRERDVSVYTNLALRAAQKLQAGDASTFQFRDRDDMMHDLTPAQMVELMDKAGLAAQAIYAAAWALKDGAEIPQDYAEDKHWP